MAAKCLFGPSMIAECLQMLAQRAACSGVVGMVFAVDILQQIGSLPVQGSCPARLPTSDFQARQVHQQAGDKRVPITPRFAHDSQRLVKITSGSSESPSRLAGAPEMYQVSNQLRILSHQMAPSQGQGLPGQIGSLHRIVEVPMRIGQTDQFEGRSEWVGRWRVRADGTNAFEHLARCQVVTQAGIQLNQVPQYGDQKLMLSAEYSLLNAQDVANQRQGPCPIALCMADPCQSVHQGQFLWMIVPQESQALFQQLGSFGWRPPG